MANALIELGVKRGDKVAFMFHNTPEFLEINFGIQVAGGVPAPMNYRFIPREVDYQGNHCDARVFLYDSIWKESVEAAAPNLKNIEHFICRGGSGLEGAKEYDEMTASADDTDPQVETGWEDVAVMIYTGGTTGLPKGVMLTYQAHLDMFSTLLSSAPGTHLDHGSFTRAAPADPGRPAPAQESIRWPDPPHRSGPEAPGLAGTAAFLKRQSGRVLSDPNLAKSAYRSAGKYMYPSMPFFHDAVLRQHHDGGALGRRLSSSCPTRSSSIPAWFSDWSRRRRSSTWPTCPPGGRSWSPTRKRNDYDLSSVRFATTGGGLCPVPLKKRILELFPNAMIIDAFGQTEMTPVTSFRVDADRERSSRSASVGKSIVEVKVVDEKGDDLPQGEVGRDPVTAPTP